MQDGGQRDPAAGMHAALIAVFSELRRAVLRPGRPSGFMARQPQSESRIMTNKDAIEAVSVAFAAGDISGFVARPSDDIVWNEAEGSALADRGRFGGPQAILDGVFERLAKTFGKLTPDIGTVPARELVGA